MLFNVSEYYYKLCKFISPRIYVFNELERVQCACSSTAELDYTMEQVTATFHPGEIYSTNITVGILEDAVMEGSEYFDLHMVLPTDYRNLSPGLDTATVTIQDNDGE